jgi:uncharacterized protein (TIGR02687 family)
MNLNEIKKSLDKMFARELRQGSSRNIVFWYDDSGAFSESIDELDLADAKMIKLYDDNLFATKLFIEREDTESNLLVYSPLPRPSNKENWLADVIKYSQTFFTDEVSLIMLNYKIDGALRPVVSEYKAFFRSNERTRKFESYGLTDFTEVKWDTAILSALCKLPAPNFDACIMTILSRFAAGETDTLDNIHKFGSYSRLWAMIRRVYGYNFEENSMEELAKLLLATHLSQSIRSLPEEWAIYKSGDTNGFVFVDGFMKNTAYAEDYVALANLVSDSLGLSEQITKWNMEEISLCDTFREFDLAIISRLREYILTDVSEYGQYKKVINNRRNLRWFADFEAEYLVLLYACEFFELFQKHSSFTAPDIASLWKLYEDELYRFDYYYRKSMYYYDSLNETENFRSLTEKLENAYTNGFLNELSVKWCMLLDEGKNGDGVIDWGIDGVIGQERFFDYYVRRFMSDDERVVVIISDALRYESAAELLGIMKREHKGTHEIFSMLGVLPSYSKLGMAALLPHISLEITNKADVLLDGQSTQGTENREKILRRYKTESLAIPYEKLTSMSKQQMSSVFNGIKLIYVYHNSIDARGDNTSTEREVFDATEKAFRELSGLVRTLKNNISAINFFVTGDHGYIYRRAPISESYKTPDLASAGQGFADDRLYDYIEKKRRFMLSRSKGELQSTQRFSLAYLGDSQSKDINVVVPRGVNLFKVQGGGANYAHGGSALQEIMVPLIKFKSGKNIVKLQGAKKVSISLISISRKITSVITYLSFFQNEIAADNLLPVRIRVYFEDGNGERISNENIIIAESASQNPDERTFKEKFTFRKIPYDKSRNYYLVVEDDDEGLKSKEAERIPFVIDLVFDR